MSSAEMKDVEAGHAKPERHSSDLSTFVDEEKATPPPVGDSEVVPASEKLEETDPNNQEIKAAQVEQPPVNPTQQPAPSAIPNGGFNAWLQVAGSFCLFFNTWYGFLSAGTYATSLTSVIGVLSTLLVPFKHIIWRIYCEPSHPPI